MPFASFQNCEVEYSVAGEGKGLVLIHGTGQSAENTWPEVVKYFSQNRKVVCPNYSGTGKTTDNGEELTVVFLAEQVLAAADHAGLDSFDVVGHSLGTCVAMYLAAHYPARVNKVGLLAGFTSTEDARSQLQFKMWKTMAETNPALLAEMFLFTAFSDSVVTNMPDSAAEFATKKIYKTTNWKGAIRQIELDLRVNVAKEAQEMQQKTLIIGCKHDFIVPISHSHKLREIIKNNQYVELDTGHAGVVENPEQFIGYLGEFLGK